MGSGFAEVNGTSLYYEIAGSGEPVVFVHGNTGDCRHYDGQFGALATDFLVARYDLRGYGKSKAPTKGIVYRDFEDLGALLEHLDLSAAHLVGFSHGASIATDLAIAHPDRVKSMVLAGPWAFGYMRGRAPEELSASALGLAEVFGMVISTVSEEGKERALERWVEYIAQFAVNDDGLRRFAEIAADYSFVHFLEAMEPDTVKFLDPWAYGRLDEVGCPVLLVTSASDLECCREVSDEFVRRAPYAREVVVQGAGHLIPLEVPEEFSRLVRDFVSEQTQSR